MVNLNRRESLSRLTKHGTKETRGGVCSTNLFFQWSSFSEPHRLTQLSLHYRKRMLIPACPAQRSPRPCAQVAVIIPTISCNRPSMRPSPGRRLRYNRESPILLRTIMDLFSKTRPPGVAGSSLEAPTIPLCRLPAPGSRQTMRMSCPRLHGQLLECMRCLASYPRITIASSGLRS